jgi:hypothetical protein
MRFEILFRIDIARVDSRAEVCCIEPGETFEIVGPEGDMFNAHNYKPRLPDYFTLNPPTGVRELKRAENHSTVVFKPEAKSTFDL